MIQRRALSTALLAAFLIVLSATLLAVFSSIRLSRHADARVGTWLLEPNVQFMREGETGWVSLSAAFVVDDQQRIRIYKDAKLVDASLWTVRIMRTLHGVCIDWYSVHGQRLTYSRYKRWDGTLRIEKCPDDWWHRDSYP